MFGLCECNCATAGLVLTIVLTYFYYKFKSIYSFWEKLGVPCEKSLPLFGSYWDNFIGKESILDTHLKIYRGNEGKKFVGTFMMTVPHLFVRDPELVTHILIKDFSCFQDRGFQVDTKLNPLLENIFFLEGERWKGLRNKLSPVFTSGKLKNMHSLLVQCSDLLLDVVKKNCENNEPVDIREIMAKFGTDVIGSCAFGLQTNALTDPNSEFRLMGKKLLTPTPNSRLRGLIRAVFPKLLGYIKMKSFPEKIEKFFLDIVKNTIKMRETNKIDRNDFIQLLLNLRKDESSMGGDIYATGKNSEVKLSDSTLAANAFLFFIAGFETTSSTISYCLFELSKNEEIQERLHNEIMAAVSEEGGLITYNLLNRIPYLDMVIEETLRKYPPALLLLRKSTSDYKLPGTEIIIPKGTSIDISVYSIHHDPKFYTDPEVFNPERFSEENKSRITKGMYMPFGDGPRICIGMRFAMMEMKVALTMFLMRYKVKRNVNTPEKLSFSINSTVLLTPKEKIILDVTVRD